MLVPYKRVIAWETEGEGDEDKSGVADPALKHMKAVRNWKTWRQAEADLLANERDLVVVNGVLCHHV